MSAIYSGEQSNFHFSKLDNYLRSKFSKGKPNSKIPVSIINEEKKEVFQDSKPYVRWWWLKGPYRKSDIRFQLDWISKQGFGGVEIAWLRPEWLADSEDPFLPPGLSPLEKTITLNLPIHKIANLLGVNKKLQQRACPLPKCGKTGTFEIYQEATRWLCSGCREKGDGIELVAKIKGKDRNSAIKWLEKKSNLHFDSNEVPEAKLDWLSEKFSEFTAFTKHEAQIRGLGCDFTFGSGWPFGGNFLNETERSQTFEGPSNQSVDGCWEGHGTPVLNHLNSKALDRYGEVLGSALSPALKGRASALFCDSLELDKDRLWDEKLWEVFQNKFGYDLRDHLDTIDSDPHLRYDYRKLIGQVILEEFYEPYTDVCHRLGALSRVQCHGAPTDLLAAYAAADIPESESLLFHPWFSRIPASSAAMANRSIISCETFTCIYGFPKKYWGKEQLLDLKLLADSLFANGINQIVWHGMPYFQEGKTNAFFTTTHVGPDSSFIDHLKDFNQYMTTISNYMKMGKTHSGLAVYLPNEDMMMRGELPDEFRVPAAKDWWEMREVKLPPGTENYSPIWISNHFLEKASVVDGQLCAGEVKVPALYLDVEWLDIDSLEQILRLAKEGLPTVLKNIPKQPGKISSSTYTEKLEELMALPNVTDTLDKEAIAPLIQGEDLPYFWLRENKGEFLAFFAHPEAQNIRYPMEYNQSAKASQTAREITITLNGSTRNITLHFEQASSLLMKISKDAEVEFLDVGEELLK